MAGVGYDEEDSIIYVHDTWDNRVHWMEWGTSYAGMAQIAVTVIHLDTSPVSGSGNFTLQTSSQLAVNPEPATISLFLLGGLLARSISSASNKK